MRCFVISIYANRTLQADELHVYLKKHQSDGIGHRFGMKFNHQTDEGVHHPPTKHLISIASKAAESGGLMGYGISGVASHPKLYLPRHQSFGCTNDGRQ